VPVINILDLLFSNTPVVGMAFQAFRILPSKRQNGLKSPIPSCLAVPPQNPLSTEKLHNFYWILVRAMRIIFLRARPANTQLLFYACTISRGLGSRMTGLKPPITFWDNNLGIIRIFLPNKFGQHLGNRWLQLARHLPCYPFSPLVLASNWGSGTLTEISAVSLSSKSSPGSRILIWSEHTDASASFFKVLGLGPSETDNCSRLPWVFHYCLQ